MRLGKKSKSFWKQRKMITEHSKFMGQIEGSLGMEVHSNTGIPKKDRNISNKQQQRKPRASRRKEITKIRAE